MAMKSSPLQNSENCPKKTALAYNRHKAKTSRIPRLYLTPDLFEQYSAIFRARAGDDGQIDITRLHEFFVACNIVTTPERMQAIMAEVDYDSSGDLDEIEFMALLIKAMSMKKRKVGPGLCPLSTLRDEHWSIQELKRTGYECKDFREANYRLSELFGCFSGAELRRVGYTLKEFIAAGWDCVRGKEAGFGLLEFVEAGCSAGRIRDAGFTDLASAAALHKHGVSASTLRRGGWPLSDLKMAGYSSTDLRLAGFSGIALAAIPQLICREREPERRVSNCY